VPSAAAFREGMFILLIPAEPRPRRVGGRRLMSSATAEWT